MSETRSRKDSHLKICTENDVSSRQRNFWDQIPTGHSALPEINFADVDTQCSFLDESYAAPFLISSMTGGSEWGDRINATLAQLAQRKNIPMGLGSQRVVLEERKTEHISIVRKQAPKARLYANLGAVQLNYGVSNDDCLWLVDQLEASAFILHLNPLQEAIQMEGDRDFSGLAPKIEGLKKQLKVPLIVKEVGCGIDPKSALRLLEAGADAIDLAGKGGTHWGYIEGLRRPDESNLGEIFRDWGIDTPSLLKTLREALPEGYPIVASGGVRNGLDAFKALKLGANFVGMAQPFLLACEKGEEYLDAFYETQSEALRIAMFCSSTKKLEEIKNL